MYKICLSKVFDEIFWILKLKEELNSDVHVDSKLKYPTMGMAGVL